MTSCADRLAVVVLTLLLCGQAFAKTKEPKKDDGKLDFPLPVGQDAKTLVIPFRDADGKLQMNFEIGVARRLDEDNMRMSSATIETYNAEGGLDLRIVLPKSVLNLGSRVLTSEGQVIIERADFRMKGSGLKFNTQTRSGSMTGHSEMEIYDRSEETK